MTSDDDIQVDLLSPASVIRFHGYDMSIHEIIASGRFNVVTPQAIHDMELVSVTMRAPSRYNSTINMMLKPLKINKTQLLAALATSAQMRLSHKYNPQARRLEKIERMIYNEDAELHDVVFGQPENIFDYVKGRRTPLNIYLNRDIVVAPMNELSRFLCISLSELIAVGMCEVFFTWEGLPDTARKMFQRDVDTLDRRVNYMLEKCEKYIT